VSDKRVVMIAAAVAVVLIYASNRVSSVRRLIG
jgi:hypothetical protein